jgi:hypothetical protein
MSRSPLITYLNDHLAGSVAALELVEHLLELHPQPAQNQLWELGAEIQEDRTILQEILETLGGKPSPLRQAAAWLTEKMSQTKFRLDDPGNGELRLLEALEMLALGIQGKASLWRALKVVEDAIPELKKFDFLRLQRRAQEQFERVDALRLRSARTALVQ